MTREEKIALRLSAIYNDPLVFLKYCCLTNDAADPAAPPTSPFPIHLPYVRQLVVDYKEEPMMVIEKARQLCVSWTFAGLFSWEILTKPNVLGLIFSQDQDKTIEFGRRVKFILDNIPDRVWPRNTRGTHLVTQEHCTIPEMNSKLLFLTSSPDKGHGYTPTFTLFDEFGYHPAAEESYRAIIGGAVKKTSRLYVVSTPPPIVGDDRHKFYQLCDDTLGEANAG